VLVPLFKQAMLHFEEAEKMRPPDNDDSILRWNRCVRLLHNLPDVQAEPEESSFEDHDLAPVQIIRGTSRAAG
jgi:hypothetical protein